MTGLKIVGDDFSSGDSPAQLLQVDKVDCVRMQVTLTEVPVFGRNQKKPRFLRRWDHQDSLTIDSDGAALIEESKWLSLEDGIQIKFLPSGSPTYRSGDYWLIPARTANGDVQWPQPGVGGRRGVEHHFAPLAIILTETNGTGIKDIIDLRTLIKPEGQETIPGGSTPASGAATPGTARASRRRTTGSGSGETPEESTPQ